MDMLELICFLGQDQTHASCIQIHAELHSSEFDCSFLIQQLTHIILTVIAFHLGSFQANIEFELQMTIYAAKGTISISMEGMINTKVFFCFLGLNITIKDTS